MSDETVSIVSIVALVFLVSSCDSVKLTPKLIEADGQTYLACSGLVWSGTEGGGLLGNGSVLKVSFTDAEGLSHKIMGIKSLKVSDIPKMEYAPMPPTSWWPDPSGKDKDGKPFEEGVPYYWDAGYSMMLKNGLWTPVKRYNTSCESIEKKAELQAETKARKSLDEIFNGGSSSSAGVTVSNW